MTSPVNTKSGDNRLIYLLFTAQHSLRKHIRDELGAAGVNITLVQSGILFLLKAQNRQSMSQLGRQLSLDNSTITRLVDRLEKAGYVKRKPNPQDRRMALIHITAQGIIEVDNAKTVIKQINAELQTGFTPAEIKAFVKVLASLVERFKNP